MEFAEEGRGRLLCVLNCPIESLTGSEMEERYERPLVGSQLLSDN
jgi:hypothetical protein